MEIKSHPDKPNKAVIITDNVEELFVVARSLLATEEKFFAGWRNEFRVAHWRMTTKEFPHDVTLTRREIGNIATGPEISYIVPADDVAQVMQLNNELTEQAATFVGADNQVN